MSDLLAELKENWESYKETERHGLEFGRVCYELHNEYVTKGKREAGKGVQAILQELDIPTRTFYWWRERYMDSQGLKELHTEKRTHRNGPAKFSDIEKAALEIVRVGFKTLLKAHPERGRILGAGHDWALGRLKGNVGLEKPIQTVDGGNRHEVSETRRRASE
jgi:hypothetical protein